MNQETQKYSTDQLWPFIALVLEMGNVGDQMGRLKGAQRYMAAMQLFDELTALSLVDFDLAKKQVTELDAAEIEDLKQKAKEKFNIVSDNLEAVIEEGLDIAYDCYRIYEKSVALYGKLGTNEASS